MKKQLVLFLALALCLGLTACGDTESDDTQSGYETVMDMEFLNGMWSIDGTAKLYFDSTEGFYAYRTRWGLGRARRIRAVRGERSADDYLTACALSLSEADTYELLSA